ncbi:MAG: 50S ribosomal protein L18 [Chlamydiales bacterium]|nr:50S ribosomal protein L18 [Chlamydiales bacterium]
MQSETKNTINRAKKRKMRIRKTLKGTAVKPRLSVFRSNQNVSVQAIDDVNGVTLAGIGTYNKEIKAASKGKTQKELSAIIGAKIAEKLKENKIETVVFDRGEYKYHGVVAALADAVREAGIKL